MSSLTPTNNSDGECNSLSSSKGPSIPPQPPPTLLKTNIANEKKDGNVWFCMQFRTVCEICVLMPLIGLVACLIVGLIFQFEHIQETACKVYNVIPSISAVTGISPGRYLWRVVIAFHIGPRILIAAVYYNFLMSFVPLLAASESVSSAHNASAAPPVSPATGSVTTTTASVSAAPAGTSEAPGQPVAQPTSKAEWLTKLLKCCYYLQVSEVVGLCAISFVHNREHYPTHEKGFILYLTSSHLSFLIILRIYHIVWPFLNEEQRWSYYKKLFIFVFSLVCISLMGYFYFRHIIHCDSFAFSIFAFAEYFVAAANMGYYWTLVNDLPDEEIVVKKPLLKNSSRNNSQSKELLPNHGISQDIPRNGHPVITAADAVKKDL